MNRRIFALALAVYFAVALPVLAEGVVPVKGKEEPKVPGVSVDQEKASNQRVQEVVTAKNGLLKLNQNPTVNPPTLLQVSPLTTQTYFYYYPSGQLSQKLEIRYDASGNFAGRWESRYARDGKLTAETEHDANWRMRFHKRYVYDASGRIEKETQFFYSVFGQVEKKVEVSYSYGDLGSLVFKEEWSYSQRGSLSGKVESLSVSGNWVEKKELFYDSWGRLERGATWFYQAAVTRRVDTDKKGEETKVTVLDKSGKVLQEFDNSYLEKRSNLSLWFSKSQTAAPSGLIASYPDDKSFIYHEGIRQDWAKIYADTQAYTYDQALVGIAMLKEGNFQGAKKIFDFYHAEWQKEKANFSGFWTVYNVDPASHWKRYEWRKGMGENAWLALFALHYRTLAQDMGERKRALDLAAAIGKWLVTLPHHEGAIAMSPPNPGGNPDYGTIYSTENNLDAYALFKALTAQPLNGKDKQLFTSELASLKSWLKTKAYDPQSGLFRTGGKVNPATKKMEWDPTKSLDVNSWAVSAIGTAALKDDFGISVDGWMSRTGKTFAVQNDGGFGGSIFEAKGFDFSDAVNAAKIGRAGIKWVEGTNQMISAYKQLSSFYAWTDRAKSAYYLALAEYFTSRNPENAVPANGALGHLYADQSGAQIYANNGYWKTAPGQAAASVAWVYFALRKVNPFDPFWRWF
ncbi:MAG: hypothetical protein HY593_06220 [Candidatus Omnitrophica bacterium]|nr:hypothetical protein [Candidatus Omnitrophota bacterium]